MKELTFKQLENISGGNPGSGYLAGNAADVGKVIVQATNELWAQLVYFATE